MHIWEHQIKAINFVADSLSKIIKPKKDNMPNDLESCCPHCGAPFDKIFECHPFSTDAGAYFACDVCNACFEPYEYEELLEAHIEAQEQDENPT